MIETIKTKLKGNEKLNRSAVILYNQRHRISLKGKRRKKVKGKNNHIKYNQTVELSNVEFDIYGNNNTIIIDDYCRLFNVKFHLKGNNNQVRIGKNVRFKRGGSIWVEDYNCSIEIKNGSTFVDVHLAAIEPHSKILIGQNCIMGSDIDVRTGDSHSIIDKNTNERYNKPKDVIIGDHVWVTSHCDILKGVSIPKDSIVSTGSIVTKPFTQEGIIIGGSPAKILKENITWEKRVVVYDPPENE